LGENLRYLCFLLFNRSITGLRIEVDKGLAKVSAVGIGMRTHAGVAHRVFAALTGAGIPIHMALSTEIRVSCLVASGDCERGGAGVAPRVL